MSAVAIGVLLQFVDLDAFLEALRLADYGDILIGFAFLVVSLVARSLGWRTLLLERAPVGKLYVTINEGYFLNNILPFRLGEVGRALLLSSTVAVLEFWQVASTILIERIFDLSISVGMLLFTLPFVIGAPWARQAAIGVGIMVSVVLGGLYLLVRNQDRFMGVYRRFGARLPILLRYGEEWLHSFFVGLSALTDGRRFLRALGWMVLVWALTLLEYYFVLVAFVPDVSLLQAAFTLGVAALGVAVPSSPGYVGVYEAALVGALSVFGVDPSVALAYAVTIHLMFWGTTAVIGIFGLVRDGMSLGRIFRRARQQSDVGT